jgi:hypothetical protein
VFISPQRRVLPVISPRVSNEYCLTLGRFVIKELRVPKAVTAWWDIIVKSLKALGDEKRDVSLPQDLFQMMGSMKGGTLLAGKPGLDPEKDVSGNEWHRYP